ncbi:MAG: hypothetical protein KAT17_08850 [Candidatus Aminicenantes bacterium]|nr:hypothetical protein [Candidatus Aminicenantes bacterium]
MDPAFQVLSRYYPDPRQNLKLLLNRALENLETGTSQSVTRLVYGVMRRQNTLDYFLANFSKIPLDQIPSENMVLLRMGIFLLIFSDSFPDHAVVNEIVSRCAHSARGFTNAILRNMARNKQQIKLETDRLTDPETKYSISKSLISSLGKLSDHLLQDLDYLNQEPLFHLRTNTCSLSASQLRKQLINEKISFKELKAFHSFEIKNPAKIIRQVLNRGYGYFQNTGSQLVSIIAAHYAREMVLDCCAAPGTKSMTLKLLNRKLKIVSNDIRLKRIQMMKHYKGYDCPGDAYLMVSDIRESALKNRFDLILADAPCTSSGTLRKNPDLKLKINPPAIREQSDQQFQILKAIIARFSRAFILYTVCSFIPEETEAVLGRLFPSASGYHTLDLSPLLETFGFRYKKARWGFYLLPDKGLNNDLFYLALIKPGD